MSDLIEVGDKKPRKRIISNGIETVYYFDFFIFNIQDLNIYINDILLTNGYRVSIKPNATGGNILFATAPKAGDIITIFRNIPLKRTTNFKEVGPFMSSKVNYEFDYQLACIEQVEESISRTVTFPPYAPTQLNANLPLPQAGKAIIWNEQEDSLQNSTFKLHDLDKHISDTLNASETNLKILAENQKYLAEIKLTKEELSDIKPYVDNLLGSKVNIDADNFTSTGKDTIIDFGMPDYSKRIAISFPFTAPSNGYITISTNQYTSSGTLILKIDGFEIRVGSCINGSSVGGYSNCTLPISKGNVLTIESIGNVTIYSHFSPFKGGL